MNSLNCPRQRPFTDLKVVFKPQTHRLAVFSSGSGKHDGKILFSDAAAHKGWVSWDGPCCCVFSSHEKSLGFAMWD